MHRVLARILAAWKLRGWVELVGRMPGPDDLVIPVVDAGALRFRHKDEGLQRVRAATDMLGWRPRRQYDLRRTFISLARADGARVDLLKWITHGPPRTVIDGYTTLPWETLCEQVACLNVQLREGTIVALPRAVAVGETPAPEREERHELHRRATPLLHRDEMRRRDGGKDGWGTRIRTQPGVPSAASVDGLVADPLTGSNAIPGESVAGATSVDAVRVDVRRSDVAGVAEPHATHAERAADPRSVEPFGARRRYSPPRILLDVDVFELARSAGGSR